MTPQDLDRIEQACSLGLPMAYRKAMTVEADEHARAVAYQNNRWWQFWIRP